MKHRISVLVFMIALGFSPGISQSSHKLLQKGDQSYRVGDFENAESYYRKSAEKDNNLKSNFNLGNTTYQLERYEEAIDHYLSSTRKTKTVEEESKAFYNLGNAYFKQQNLQEALNAYKQSIRIDNKNDKARYNLAMVKEILKRMQKEEKQNQQNQEQNQDQENNQEQNQDQQGEEQENQEQNKDQSESQKDSTQQIESNFDSSRLEKQNLDSLDAAKLLQIIQNEEQKVQEKLRKFNSNRNKPDKDW